MTSHDEMKEPRTPEIGHTHRPTEEQVLTMPRKGIVSEWRIAQTPDRERKAARDHRGMCTAGRARIQ